MSAETISFQISGLTDYNLNFGWHDRHFMQPFFETFFFTVRLWLRLWRGIVMIAITQWDITYLSTMDVNFFIKSHLKFHTDACNLTRFLTCKCETLDLFFSFSSYHFFFFSKSVYLSKSLHIFWNIDYCWILFRYLWKNTSS